MFFINSIKRLFSNLAALAGLYIALVVVFLFIALGIMIINAL